MPGYTPLETSFHSYPKIYALGHAATSGILSGPVLCDEKVDGSQVSFGVFDGKVRIRSHNREFDVEAPDDLFAPVVATVKDLAWRGRLVDGWTYRGETLKSPHHNTLTYDRVPTGNVIIFDVNMGYERYLSYEERAAEADRLGLEVAPRLFQGTLTAEMFDQLLGYTSVLGGSLIEGIVIKPLIPMYGVDGKAIMAKYVSERFKEVHAGAWKSSNPTNADVIETLISKYVTPARWDKAVIHAREDGLLEGSPRDIGVLMKAIGQDLHDEEAEAIKEDLFRWAWPKIQRAAGRGFPEHYKRQLAEGAFSE